MNTVHIAIRLNIYIKNILHIIQFNSSNQPSKLVQTHISINLESNSMLISDISIIIID